MPRSRANRSPAKKKGGRGSSKQGKRPAPPKRSKKRTAPPRINPQQGERLQKVLAAAGLASRREAEEIIREGRVVVDGQVVTELGTRVDPSQQAISVDGETLPQPKRVYFAVNKPAGVVSTARDPAGRPRVIDLLPPGLGRVFNVGRLDLASEGLILVTNDGPLANKLTHPRHGVEKTYEVQVQGHPDSQVLSQLRKGFHLAEGFARAVNVKIKSKRKNGTVLEMVLDEGRNREIRRMLARVGHKVQRLTRVAVGPVRLGELPRGAVRRLKPEEVKKLRAYVREPGQQKVEEQEESTSPKKRQASTAKRKGTKREAPSRKK